MASSASCSSGGSSRKVGSSACMTCWEALCSSSLQNRAPESARRILEAMDDDLPDPRPAQLEQDTGVGRGEVGVDQQRQRGKELPEPLDPVGPRVPAPEQRVHHGHVHRLGPDGLDRFGPTADRDPLEPVRIQGAESESALSGDGGEEEMSQNGPYLSQKGPYNPDTRPSDWRQPLVRTDSLRGYLHDPPRFEVDCARVPDLGRPDLRLRPGGHHRAFRRHAGVSKLRAPITRLVCRAYSRSPTATSWTTDAVARFVRPGGRRRAREPRSRLSPVSRGRRAGSTRRSAGGSRPASVPR